MTTRLFARRFRPVVSLLLLGGMLCTATAALGRDIDWKEGKLGRLSQYIGTYHYDAVLDDPKVAAALHALAGSASRILRANLNVVAPIEFVDECLVLQGNAPHEGGSEEAMVLIKPYDGTVRAALLHAGRMTLYDSVDAKYAYVPRVLKAFLKPRRMTTPNDPPPGVVWVRGAPD